jgi:integrase
MMNKRANGEGCAIKKRKDGRFWTQIMDGYQPDGKRRRVDFYGATQKEVKDKLQEYQAQKKRGKNVKPSQITVGEWLDEWFRVYGCPRWEQGTAKTHLFSLENFIKPAFGSILLQKLTITPIQSLINKLIDEGYSTSYVCKILEPLENALKQALDSDYITKNPAAKIKKPKRAQEEIKFLSIGEQRVLIDRLPDTTAGRALRFVLCTGLRAGELCGLQWGDIEDGILHVRRSIRYMRKIVDGKREDHQSLQTDPPKTKAGRRAIPLNANACAVLGEQRGAQAAHRLRVGNAWTGETPASKTCYVFASATGQALDASNLNRTLTTCLKSVGLERRGVHALRHTFATNLVRAGVDVRTLTEIMGHTKVAFTIQLYIHSDMDTKRVAMKMLEGFI